jgi:Predicted N-acetylglucosamine kinase
LTDLFIGVDGGGSRTRALVGDEQGNELGSAEGPRSAVTPGNAEASAKVIAVVVREALAQAVMPGVAEPRVLYCGVAGIGRDVEQRSLLSALEDENLAERVVVDADGAIALYDAFGDSAGILLVSGTGSIAYGRGPSGNMGRCGGWGPNIGDEGSGAWIGRRALAIVAAASDGRERETALVGAILTATQTTTPADLIPWAAAATVRDIAALAPVVMASAAAGDSRANSLITLAAEELVVHVRALTAQLFGDDRSAVPVALSGGALKKGLLLRKRVEQRLRSAVPGSKLRTEEVVPVRGALRAAVKNLHPIGTN